MIHHMTPGQLNVNQVEQKQDSVKSTSNVKQTQHQFKNLLSEKLNQDQLKFSSHASKRLAMRGIELSAGDIESLKQAVNLAESKGSKDALIMHEKAAFVVSIRNRTVITAIDDMNMKDRIVTNIDSAVIARNS